MPLGESDVYPRDDAAIALRDEFVDAFSKAPTTVVQTPGAPHSEDTVAGILKDELSSEDGLEHFEMLLRLVAQFAFKSRDAETRLSAMEWICKAGVRHAERHADARVILDMRGSR